ncbi:MAG TPA: hypothetical protein VH083_19165 [Myxococcales bacterium]|nr:hypothetical protein [Myxococcales bacterium]
MVNGVSGSSETQASSAQGKMQKMKEDVLSAVASELGESESDLQKGLSGGQSLTQLAAAKGISSDDLKSTIAGVVQKDMPNASPDQVANVTNRMMQGAHGHHHGGHHMHTDDSSTTSTTTPAVPDGSTVSVVA